jgi:hypothetical protein
MRRKTVGLFLFAMALWAGTIWGGQGDVVELVGNGEINWSQGVILAKGRGAPPGEARNIAQARLMAERASLADARHNLMEVLKQIPVDSENQVGNYLAGNDEIRLRVERLIQNSVELKDRRRFLSDGVIEITVAMNLKGDLLLLLLRPPKELPRSKLSLAERPSSQTAPASSEKNGETSREMLQVQVEEKLAAGAKPLPRLADLPPFTGLVINTRGLNMQAVLIPKILAENGQELYPGQYVSPEKAAQNGLALYTKDLSTAQKNPRVGKKPLTVEGCRVDPNHPSEIILSNEDSKRVAPFAQEGTFLEEGKVMIVLD